MNAISADAQDISQASLAWKVSSLLDEQSGQSISYSCSFRTNGSNDIVWSQKNGNFTTTLIVLGISGNWPDVTTHGQVTYQVQSGNESGTLEFFKDANGVHVRINLSQGSSSRMRYEFAVEEVKLTNP